MSFDAYIKGTLGLGHMLSQVASAEAEKNSTLGLHLVNICWCSAMTNSPFVPIHSPFPMLLYVYMNEDRKYLML
jgi:hypothetical protein